MHQYHPCPECSASCNWIPCPDNCGTGYVPIIDEESQKVIDMKECQTCVARGHRRMGGQLVCPHCGWKEVVQVLPVDPFSRPEEITK